MHASTGAATEARQASAGVAPALHRGARAYLHAQLVVKVAEAQHLGPEAFVAGQRVHPGSGAHGVELRAEGGVARDVRPARTRSASQRASLRGLDGAEQSQAHSALTGT
jgi:hypothetical protein